MRILKRIAAILISFALSTAASFGQPLVPLNKNPVLVLMQPHRADPVVDLRYYVHPNWVKWPVDQGENRGNRVLSMMAGFDPIAEPKDFAFTRGRNTDPPSSHRSSNFASLEARGYHGSRPGSDRKGSAVHAAVIRKANGTTNPTMLLLGFGSDGLARTFDPADQWPSGAIMVSEADTWDEVKWISQSTTGRVVVVEFPVPEGQHWSRMWLFGDAWGPAPDPMQWRVPFKGSSKDRTGLDTIPGLILARDLPRLLQEPDTFGWTFVSANQWQGANRWLSAVARSRPVLLLIWGTLAVTCVGLGLFRISQQRSSPVVRPLVQLTFLAPTAFVLAGGLARFGGIGGWWTYLLLSFVLLGAIHGVFANGVSNIRESDWGLPTALMSAFGLTLIPPDSSIFSVVLGIRSLPETSVPGELAGILFGAWIVLAAHLNKATGPKSWKGYVGWVLFAVLTMGIGLASVAIGAPQWWIAERFDAILLPLTAFLIGTDRWRAWLIPVISLRPEAVARCYGMGATWAPADIFASGSDAAATNYGEWLRVVASPIFLTFAVVLLTAFLSLGSYAGYRLQQTWRRRPMPKKLAIGAASLGSMALFDPVFLHGALVLLLGAGLALVCEAATDQT